MSFLVIIILGCILGNDRHPLALDGAEHVEKRLPLCSDPEPVTTATGIVELIANLRTHFETWRRQTGQPTDCRVLAHLLAPMHNAHGVKDADHVWGFPAVDWSKLPGWPTPHSDDDQKSLRTILAWAESKAEKPQQQVLEAAPEAPTADKETLALATLAQHPEWSDAAIARSVGCHRTSLYRWNKYRQAREILEQGKHRLPAGSKGVGGQLEAWDT